MRATATVDLQELAATIPNAQRCCWLRMECPECGEYDAALPARTPEPRRCHWCRGLVLVTARAAGYTIRALPDYSLPRVSAEQGREPLSEEPQAHRGGRMAVLEPGQIRGLVAIRQQEGLTIAELARRFHVSYTAAWAALHGHSPVLKGSELMQEETLGQG